VDDSPRPHFKGKLRCRGRADHWRFRVQRTPGMLLRNAKAGDQVTSTWKKRRPRARPTSSRIEKKEK